MDEIVTVNFFDCNDLASRINELAYGHRACHVGLCVGDRYLFPSNKEKVRIRSSAAVYYHLTPVYSISLLGRPKEENWIEKFNGRMIDSSTWRLITEPIYVLKDAGLQVNVPKRTICVDIISDALREIGIPTISRTPHAFLKELMTHSHRIG